MARFGAVARDAAFTTATVAAPATTPPAAAIATVRASLPRRETSPAARGAGGGTVRGVHRGVLLDRLCLQDLFSHEPAGYTRARRLQIANRNGLPK